MKESTVNILPRLAVALPLLVGIGHALAGLPAEASAQAGDAAFGEP